MNHGAAEEAGNISVGGIDLPFVVLRSRRRRRSVGFDMSASMLRIYAPMRMSLWAIRAVMKKNEQWISKRLNALTADDFRPEQLKFIDGDIITYLGHRYRLCVTQLANLPQGCRLWPRRIEVNIHGALSDEARRQEVRLEIMLWLKKRAKAKLQKRLDLWATRMGLSYKHMVVSNAVRQWGSCNSQNIIRLNWRLILAPLHLLDYVAVHELAHVPHKNHSQRFWRCVASVMPDSLDRRKHLRRIGGRLVL